MLKVNTNLRFALTLLLLVCTPIQWAMGQSRQSGEIRGTVVDPSQAPIQDAKVTITNDLTGVSQTATTNSTGGYYVPYVTPGEYTVSFEKAGFKTLVHRGIELHVETVTVDATLEVGAISEQVSVTAEAPLVQTESAVKSTTLSSQVVTDSPSINRSWYDLLASVPGVNPGGGEQASGQGIAVNGQQPFNASWQIDGGIAMFGQSANPDALTPPLESIEEVSLSTANFGAEHGNGLSVFNVITKSGTNNFHGSLYEYIENEFFNARNFFTQGSKPVQRWNEYGGNIGGPIKRNKAFFFLNYERNPIRNFSPFYQTYPSNDFKNGDFSALLGAQTETINPCYDSASNPAIMKYIYEGEIFDPNTTQTVNDVQCRLPFYNAATGKLNQIPTARFDPLAAQIQSYFPAAQDQTSFYNNYYQSLGNPVTNSWTNAKVDFNLTPSNRLSASFLYSTFNQEFLSPICELMCGAWAGNESQGQITDVWTITPYLVSEFRFSLSRASGNATVASQGKGYPAKLNMVNPIGDLFPTVWIDGGLSTGIGYPQSYFPPAQDVETTFIPSEVVTWVKGRHLLKVGGEFDRWWVNTGWGTIDNGGYWFGGGFTNNPADGSGGAGYADFLLGKTNAYWITINPITQGRMWSAQFFAQDDYKVKPNLTLSLGLRYVIQSGWSEVNNQISSFDPNIINPATNTPGAMWYAGENGRTALTKTIPDFFAPRVGVAWAPKSNLSVRGGFGIYNIIAGQNTTGPAYAWGQGWIPAYTGSGEFQFSAGPPSSDLIFPTNGSQTLDMLNGGNVTYSIYNSPLSYAMEYQFDVQYQVKGDIVFDLGYVGNRGVNLQFGRDFNQVPDNKLGQGQDARPYPQFGNLMAAYFDGRSNYNALQVGVRKRTAQGLTFAVNYSFSKALDTLTSAGWGGSGAIERGGYQDAYAPNANYGPSTNDVRHMLNGSLVYQLPFGEGQRFANKVGVVNALIGGWQFSSIFLLRTGLPFTPVMYNDNSGAGTTWGHHAWRPDVVGNPGNGTCPSGAAVGTLDCWFNTSAFTSPADNTFGNLGRNTLRGPNWATVDIALLKNIPLKIFGEFGRLQFKWAVTDVFNHPNFGFPNRVLDPNPDAGSGVISYANSSRQMQLGLKLSF